jgi:putative membrane protein
MLAALVSALHVLSLGIGLGAVFARGRAFRVIAAGDAAAARSALLADNYWAAAALLWVATGLARLFGGLEKGFDFYLYNGFFWLKIGLFGLILVLELVPMTTLIRWRIALSKGNPIDTGRVALLARINGVEIALVVVIPFVAAAMARGLWLLA